jgi:hypothetical protein
VHTFTIRLLALGISAAALTVIPLISPVKAATGDSQEKVNKKIHRSAGAGERKSPDPTWPPPMYDDFDRRNGGGGGM